MAIYNVDGQSLEVNSNVVTTIPDVSLSQYDSRVKGVNHRGYNTTAPENTIPAFQLSKTNGFFYVETDVQFTSDGVPVLIHDAYINDVARNADGTAISSRVYIANITYAEALTYDFGVWKSQTYQGTKIATFDEFIDLCRNIGLHPYIELKTCSQMSGKITNLMNTVYAKGMHGKVTWISFNENYLSQISLNDPTARIGLLVSDITSGAISSANGLKTGANEVFIDADVSNISAEKVQLCENASLPLEIWTVNNSNIITAMNTYITGVTSNSLIAGKVLYDANIT